ncbi:MAG: S-layer homology domain-containing protein [Clostridiales bacterium]|jgi:hypothetical protein|nr:S-layer homology domain-containing protein [Clostridiales bacterium]
MLKRFMFAAVVLALIFSPAGAARSFDIGVIDLLVVEGSNEERTYIEGILTIISNGTYRVTSGGVQTSNRIVVAVNVIATVILDNVNILTTANYSPLTLNSGANVTIVLNGDNFLLAQSTSTRPGINIAEAALIIEGGGSLTARGGEKGGAGIGGGQNGGCGSLTINSGRVEAIGGSKAAGIGGGEVNVEVGYGAGANAVTINGGTVIAVGGTGGAGIGGGALKTEYDYGKGSFSVRINGGTVTATAGNNAKDIEIWGLSEDSLIDGDAVVFFSDVVDEIVKIKGIVFEGNVGCVYGSVNITQDMVIDEGYTLIIPEGSELIIADGVTIENNGTIKVFGIIRGNVTGNPPVPTPSPTPEPTATPSPTPNPTATPSPTPGPTATPSPTPNPTATPSPTPGPTATPSPTPNPTATPSPTPNPTATPSPTPNPTATPSPTPNPTATPSPTPGPTATPSPTPNPTATPSPTPGPTATPSPTPGPTATPSPTPGPTATPSPTPGPTATPSPTLEPTATPSPTPGPTATPSPKPEQPPPTLRPNPTASMAPAATQIPEAAASLPLPQAEAEALAVDIPQSAELFLTSIIEDKEFTDVNAADWFYDDVHYVYTHGIFTGTGDETFGPDEPMTRGMFVAVLGRLSGIDPAQYDSGVFSDVDKSRYYAVYAEWARRNGIVTGIGHGVFAPDAEITREDIAVVLKRFCGYKNIDLPAVRPGVRFSDSGSISDYAREAVDALFRAGIINGKGNGYFDPASDATRAEVSATLRRLIQAARAVAVHENHVGAN